MTEQLTDEQVNERLALAMGWKIITVAQNKFGRIKACHMWIYGHPYDCYVAIKAGDYLINPWPNKDGSDFDSNASTHVEDLKGQPLNYFIKRKEDWDPCNNDTQMRLVRDEIARRGLQKKFAYILSVELGLDPITFNEDRYYDCGHTDWGAAFDLLNAPCPLQARAALKVLEE